MEPTQQDLQQELQSISSDLCDVRIALCIARSEEKTLMKRRNQIRSQLRVLRDHVQVIPIRSPVIFNGTSEPSCPDAIDGEL